MAQIRSVVLRRMLTWFAPFSQALGIKRDRTSDIKFSREEIDRIVRKIKSHFKDELDQEIGSFETEFSIDFFAKEIGPYFYSRGIFDAQALFNDKAQEINYMIQELEKPTT